MASKLLGFCARVLRPVMEEVVQQQRREEDLRRAIMTPAEVQASVQEFIRAALPLFDQSAEDAMHPIHREWSPVRKTAS